MAAIHIDTATKVVPQCYAYTTPGIPSHDGWTKIGFTERDVETRINEQTHTAGIPHKTWWHLRAAYMTEPFGTFTDKEFHSYLKKLGINRQQGTEWFQIDPKNAKEDFVDFTQNHGEVSDEVADAVIPYKLREEQDKAVTVTLKYFENHDKGEFLWNAKPRFGKTLSAYDLCKRMHATKVLIVTNRPAIANSWYSDYETFFGPQSGFCFVSSVDGIKDRKYVMTYDAFHQKVLHDDSDNIKGLIEFVSLQDLKGSIYFGGQYEKLGECSDYKKDGREIGYVWDLLIVDEAHEGVDTYKTDVAFNHIRRKYTLHLSGTPFKALASEKFPDDAIFNWTYADEQKKKRDWDDTNEQENPYENLPKLNLYTYQMSDIVRDKVKRGIELADNDVEEYAFDLNEFFATNESGKFVHDADVDRFLDALTHQEKFPFSTDELRNELKHTFWILNRVASAKALAKKLHDHPVFSKYHIVPAFGDGKIDEDDAATNEKSFDLVREAIRDYDKTITLSVGQLTTGVTIPEWTAVLILSNMKSPALYMQAAFRAQNPCLFHDREGNSYRKKNAYVFDFDPARTLDIFERFANDLIPETSGERGDFDQRKNNVRELLNFFPVYGEDDQGKMVALDAESVLTIPRHIHAKEVVERGFMSNFLFANISGIFGAPKEIIDIINGLHPLEEPKNKLPNINIDDGTADELHLNDENKVEIPDEQVIGLEQNLFGDKVYGDVQEQFTTAVQEATADYERKDPKRDELKELKKTFSKPLADTLMSTAKQQYGSDLKKSTENTLQRKIEETTDAVVNREYGDYTIQRNQMENAHKEELKAAQKKDAPMEEISRLNAQFETQQKKNYEDMVNRIQKQLSSEETIQKTAQTIVKTVETEKSNAVKDSIESDVRDHLRGFSRTIPAFLMAYGDENTTLANFDQLVPADVFWEVTVNPQSGKGVTMDQFRLLRDGGDYYQKDNNGNEIRDDAHKKHFQGHLFDEVVFNDAVQEFMKKKSDLADYFDENSKGDIFDYIPPQRTNQIFTPKWVVKDMVDRLEKETPGCFDDPDNTFADLYMKSGMYITEIVTRLYQSKRMKALFPDSKERLNHIFAHQVYGCAPTEIIYRICLSYILGFNKEIHIDKYNIKLCDTLKYAKEEKLNDELRKIFDL
jgi:type II restriction enzyme